MVPIAFFVGIAGYAIIRVLIRGFYTVRPDERAVLTAFGQAERLPGAPARELIPSRGPRGDRPPSP